MNIHLLVLLLAVLLFASVFVSVMLYMRLRQKDASQEPAEDVSAPINETAAIDQYLYDRCCRYMTERRPFLVESFTLQDLAHAIFSNKTYLSKTINRFSGKNFRQYVNYYRVMYSMELFRKNMGLRVVDLAQLSGFRSETSYLRNFKDVMGEKPSTWCSRMRKRNGRNF